MHIILLTFIFWSFVTIGSISWLGGFRTLIFLVVVILLLLWIL
jgi:hypothetical protein